MKLRSILILVVVIVGITAGAAQGGRLTTKVLGLIEGQPGWDCRTMGNLLCGSRTVQAQSTTANVAPPFQSSSADHADGCFMPDPNSCAGSASADLATGAFDVSMTIVGQEDPCTSEDFCPDLSAQSTRRLNVTHMLPVAVPTVTYTANIQDVLGYVAAATFSGETYLPGSETVADTNAQASIGLTGSAFPSSCENTTHSGGLELGPQSSIPPILLQDVTSKVTISCPPGTLLGPGPVTLSLTVQVRLFIDDGELGASSAMVKSAGSSITATWPTA